MCKTAAGAPPAVVRRIMHRPLLVALVLTAGPACSGSQPASPTPVQGLQTTTTTSIPVQTQPTVTITASGLSPREITISVGMTVTFVNNDVRPHDLFGGPDPATRECPEIDVAGFLTPGQSRDTGLFTVPRVCRYHDHTALGVPEFLGTITIQ
jgi:plastocyanin